MSGRQPQLKAVEILLVEDNPGDVVLATTALSKAKISNHVNVVRDGEQALAWLRREPPYEDAVRPDVILLDLNLPRRDGREVLEEIKSDPELLRIPVVVLTSSKAEEDVLRSYNLHANCYVTKPIDFSQLMEVVRNIEHFWLAVVSLPPE